MEEELKKGICKHTKAIVATYKALSKKLEQLPSQPDLAAFLTHLNSSLAVYKQQYSHHRQVDLQACRLQYEPIRGLNQIEQVFNNLEQGFYTSYPNKEFENKVHQFFKDTNTDFDKLNELIAKIIV